MIMQRQVLQSCVDPLGCLSFSSSTEWTVYEMVASCASFCCAQRQVPTVLLFLQGSGCCSTLTRLSMLGLVALWRLVKEFHIFSTCSRFSPGIWTLFPRAPCSGSHLLLCVATVHGSFWTNFVYFLREKWTPTSPRSSHLGNLNIISTSSIWQRTKPPVPASVYVLLEEFHIFST